MSYLTSMTSYFSLHCYCHYLSQINIFFFFFFFFFFFSRRRRLTPSFHLLGTSVLSHSAEYLRTQSHPLLLLQTPRCGDTDRRRRPGIYIGYVTLTPLPDSIYDLDQPRTTYMILSLKHPLRQQTSPRPDSRHCRLLCI